MTRAGDVALVLTLTDEGLGVGEAARVIQRARATLDSHTETVELAAARILAQQAAELEAAAGALQAAAADYRHAGEQLRSAA